MKKTIGQVIASFNLVELQKKYAELHQVGAPRLFIEGIKAMMEDAKAGKVTVKGMARKHQIGDKEVTRVYAATTVAYDWAKPHHGDEMPTTVLMFVDDVGEVYFWDYYTNTIGKSQAELSIKGVESRWVSWICPDEANEPSGYWDIIYTPPGQGEALTVTIFAADESSARDTFLAQFGSWVDCWTSRPITKAAAIERKLNF